MLGAPACTCQSRVISQLVGWFQYLTTGDVATGPSQPQVVSDCHMGLRLSCSVNLTYQLLNGLFMVKNASVSDC